jgi:ABC-type glycerol-3-phosphate transport system substrate-binding protein
MKKLLFLLPAVFWIGGNLFTGCAKQDPVKESLAGVNPAIISITNTPAAQRPHLPTTSHDLGGLVLKFGATWNEGIWYYDPPANDMDYMINNARYLVQRDNNFTHQQVQIGTSGDDYFEALVTQLMARKPEAHYYDVSMAQANTLYRRGLLAPLNPNDYIKFNEPVVVWNSVAQEAFTVNGVSYAWSFSSGSGTRPAVYWNKRIFEEAGIDPMMLYDLQKKETWDWDQFLDLARKLTRDTNNDGIIDVYGIGYDPATLLDAVVFGNGAEFVKSDAGKILSSGLQTNEFTRALQFYQQITTGENISAAASSTTEDYIDLFRTGKVAMLVSTYGVASYGFGEAMIDDHGMVVFPKGPNTNVYHAGNSVSVYVIPASYSKAEVQNILWGAYLREVPEMQLTPAEYRGVLLRYRSDVESINETYQYYMQMNGWKEPGFGERPGYLVNRNHNMVPGISIDDFLTPLKERGANITQIAASVSAKWQTAINDYNSGK